MSSHRRGRVPVPRKTRASLSVVIMSLLLVAICLVPACHTADKRKELVSYIERVIDDATVRTSLIEQAAKRDAIQDAYLADCAELSRRLALANADYETSSQELESLFIEHDQVWRDHCQELISIGIEMRSEAPAEDWPEFSKLDMDSLLAHEHPIL